MTKQNDSDWLEDTLKSLGKNTFIKYYELFETHAFDSSNDEIIKAFDDENWEQSSKATKANCGKRIFRADRAKDALYICLESKLEKDLIDKCKKLLSLYDDSSAEWSCTLLIVNQSIKETARDIFFWAMDNETLAQAIVNELKLVNKQGDTKNIANCYSFPAIGNGSFILSFKKEPKEKELYSGTKERYFNTPIEDIYLGNHFNKSHWYYISNQWTLDKTNFSLTALVEFIKKHLPDNLRIEFNVKANKLCFYAYERFENDIENIAFIKEDNITREEIREIEKKINKDIAKYKHESINKTDRIITNQKLFAKFKSSLKSQNRVYADRERCFFPGLISRLYTDYSDNIENQINNIIVYDENRNPIELMSFNKFYIRFDGFYGTKTHYKKDLVKLFFMIGETLHSFGEFIQYAEDISLEHVNPMTDILKPDTGTALRTISDIYYANTHLDPKTKEGLDGLVKLVEGEIEINQLIKELTELENKTIITILPTKINKAKGGR